jgi:hypothetical protein
MGEFFQRVVGCLNPADFSSDGREISATGGGGGSPGGNPNDLQFNDAGAFGGNDSLQYFPPGISTGNGSLVITIGHAGLFIGDDVPDSMTDVFSAQADRGNLALEMNGADLPGGILILCEDTGGISIDDESTGGIVIGSMGGRVSIEGKDASVAVVIASNNGSILQLGGPVSGGITMQGNLGFFAKTPVAQQTATDLPSVIALLKAYGLSA